MHLSKHTAQWLKSGWGWIGLGYLDGHWAFTVKSKRKRFGYVKRKFLMNR